MSKSSIICGLWTIQLLLVLPVTVHSITQETSDFPCNVKDLINITKGQKNADDSIMFDGMRCAKGDSIFTDYTIDSGNNNVSTQQHTRGCLCKTKKCISYCCPRGSIYSNVTGCSKPRNFSMPIALWNHNNKLSTVDMLSQFRFEYVSNIPCKDIIDEGYPSDKWHLYDNGYVLYHKETLGPHDYCIMFQKNESDPSKDPQIRLVTCFKKLSDIKYIVLPYGMLISVPFLIATFLVYALLPELRNMHGKCLLCYLFSLAMGYITMSLLQLNGNHYVEPMLCRPVGFLAYFSFLCAFFWLNVISFDLWWNFRGMKGISMLSANKQFTIYFVYACGLSTLLVIFAYAMDRDSIPSDFRPGFGFGNCFLQKKKLTEFLYFYLIIAIIITLNSVFFILTATKIRRVQKEFSRMVSEGDSCTHRNSIRKEENNFRLFLRLFIIMGVTWCMEAISWFIDSKHVIFLVADFFNTIQGVPIFFLFVVKPNVKQLICKRWKVLHGMPLADVH